MFQNDYHTIAAQAADRRREMQAVIASAHLAEQSTPNQHGLYRQTLDKLGDALIAGGSRLKAAADLAHIETAKA